MPETIRQSGSTFSEISGRARESISEYFGEWTDLNAHDPGITLIELFSWLTEMQRYYIENSAEAQLLFNAFNIKRLHAAPAVAYAELSLEEKGGSLALPVGTPLNAENTRFETAAPATVCGIESTKLKRSGEDPFDFTRCVFFPFGEKPEPGYSFEVLLKSEGLSGNVVLSVKMRCTPRNPIAPGEDAFLSKLLWECLTEGGFAELPVIDGTCGLIRSGEITLLTGSDLIRDNCGNYVFRCTLLSHEYDIAPALTGLQTNIAGFKQTHSLCETLSLVLCDGKLSAGSFLALNGENMLFIEKDGVYRRVSELEKKTDVKRGEAVFTLRGGESGKALLVSCEREYLHHRVLGMTRGFPNQRLKVETRGKLIVYESFSILVSDSFGLDTAVIWEKTESLHCSGPCDRHYELCEETGEIVFGDGFHGRMPSGAVIIASLALTDGSRGNIKAGGLEGFDYAGRRVRALQTAHADGGRDRESSEQALKRVTGEFGRAVTAGDYEEIVKSTPGLIIERVAAFVSEADAAGENLPPVTVAVKTIGERAGLSRAYKTRILERLEPCRLAGTRINVEPPVYVNVRLTAELSGRTYWRDIGPAIEEKLRAHFRERYGEFGAVIRFGEILAFLDSLPEVTRALSLHMRADGQGAVADSAGNILLGERCIAHLEQVDIFVIYE